MEAKDFSLWRSIYFLMASTAVCAFLLGGIYSDVTTAIEADTLSVEVFFNIPLTFFLIAFAYSGYRMTSLSIETHIDIARMKGEKTGSDILHALFTDEEIAMRRVDKEIKRRELERLQAKSGSPPPPLKPPPIRYINEGKKPKDRQLND